MYENKGIILYVTGGNAATYKDGKGVSRAAGTNLSAAAWRRSDVIQIGRGQRCAVTVSGVLSGGALGVKVRGETQYDDPPGINSGVTWAPAAMAMQRGDGSAAANAENMILAADLVGVDGNERNVTLLTENTGPSGSFSVIVETTGAPGVGDQVIVAVEVL